MNLKNIIDKIDKEIQLADAGLANAEADSISTYQFWDGYKKGLQHTKDLLIIKIEKKKQKSNS